MPHNADNEFSQLDALIQAHPPAAAPADFSSRLMQRIENLVVTTPFWERPWIQWMAASMGLVFTLSRLLNYIFSAWLAVELAG